MIKFQAQIIGLGSLISEFSEQGILVFFGSEVPSELADFSILHDGKGLAGEIVVGDWIYLDQHPFQITAVGNVVNKNFASLGHLVMKFDGSDHVKMPGEICVEQKPIPQLSVGLEIQITD